MHHSASGTFCAPGGPPPPREAPREAPDGRFLMKIEGLKAGSGPVRGEPRKEVGKTSKKKDPKEPALATHPKSGWEGEVQAPTPSRSETRKP